VVLESIGFRMSLTEFYRERANTISRPFGVEAIGFALRRKCRRCPIPDRCAKGFVAVSRRGRPRCAIISARAIINSQPCTTAEGRLRSISPLHANGSDGGYADLRQFTWRTS
jgi:hypothetical protein